MKARNETAFIIRIVKSAIYKRINKMEWKKNVLTNTYHEERDKKLAASAINRYNREMKQLARMLIYLEYPLEKIRELGIDITAHEYANFIQIDKERFK